MGTVIIQVRLPDDHWLLKEKNINKSQVIRNALELQQQLPNELRQLNQTVQEIKDMLGSGQISINQPANQPVQPNSNIDPRLMNVLDDFLD